ncbi:MAG TPA: helix-turn-helix domain-containing protein [Prolixibacteraceae bacterium]|nr:helix-turn-helix domain-containing protein [Prolixibacteraceae bacterium]
MGFSFAKPSGVLSPYVKQYWGLENCLPVGEEHVQRIVPNGMMELTFYLSSKPSLVNHTQQSMEHSVLSGHCTGPYDLVITGDLRMFSVSFKPLGASMFFNIPMKEFFGCIVPARMVWKEAIDRLESILAETDDFNQKVRRMEEFLVRRLSFKEDIYSQQRMQESIRMINLNRGVADVEQLASSACWSRKQYERNFQDIIGTSPKQFMRIVRFQHALHYKSQHPLASLTELAYESGFFDQSHMINEFKDLAGVTPRQYFAECEPVSDYFAE